MDESLYLWFSDSMDEIPASSSFFLGKKPKCGLWKIICSFAPFVFQTNNISSNYNLVKLINHFWGCFAKSFNQCTTNEEFLCTWLVEILNCKSREAVVDEV
jgi:hypothetical protein